jgi:predicted SAM-dependent methyltransferase
MKLHLGCGDKHIDGYTNIDIRYLPGVDEVDNVARLRKYKPNSISVIYASHVLEHFEKAKTQSIVSEWVRILKPGGMIRLSVPSLENLIKIYEITGDMEYIIGPLMGGQTYAQNYHYNMFDKKRLTEYLENAGCEAVHPWDYRRTSHSRYFDFSQATTWEIPISLNLEARKS